MGATNYLEIQGVEEQHQLAFLGEFLTGKAKTHYVMFIAKAKKKKRSVVKYLKKLFRHCFPARLRMKMLEEFH